MNRGDAETITLDITIDDRSITQADADEIELTFNPDDSIFCIKKTLSNNEIVWNSSLNKYEITLSQQDTFTMKEGDNKVQVRVLKSGDVLSSDLVSFVLGPVNSKDILAISNL